MKGPFVGENEPRGLAIFDPYCRERACQRSQCHGRSTVGVAKQLKGSDCKRFCERVPIARRHDMKGVMILIPSTTVAYKDKCVTVTENGRAPAKPQFETREEAERWYKVLLDSKA